MIESLTLAGLAAARRPVALAAVHPRTPTAPPSMFTAIVLWHEPATLETKYQRDDAWRVLIPGATPADVQTGLVFAADALEHAPAPADDLTRADAGATPLAPLDLTGSFSSLAPAALLEAVCLLALHRSPVAFRYAKVGEVEYQPRNGRALGTKNGLLFVEDAARQGETRSFRLDRIVGLHVPAGTPVPRWDGARYVAPVVDGGAPCPF